MPAWTEVSRADRLFLVRSLVVFVGMAGVLLVVLVFAGITNA